MFDYQFRNCSLLLIGIIALFSSVSISFAASFENIELNTDEYYLVDVKVNKLTLLTDVEIYVFDNEVYIPYLSIIEALELKHNSRFNDDYYQVFLDSKSNWIDIKNAKENLNAPVNTVLKWASSDYEKLFSTALMSLILNVKIDFDSSLLSLNIETNDEKYMFPIEKRLSRISEEKVVKSRRSNVGKPRHFYSEEVLIDHYHLITPPTGAIGLSMYSNPQKDINLGINTSLSADFLYHSGTLNLYKNNDSDIKAYLRFNGAKTSPYEILPLGISNYDFGDVSASSTGSSVGGSGIGFTFRSSEVNFSRDFGKTVIEGQATSGWEAELYLDGYFIAQQKVDENGLYKFEDVTTEYGTNTYKVKLYGPFGELEERVETINISGNWLKKGETRFKGGFIEKDEYLLQGGIENGFSPDNIYYGFDYGINDKYQLGMTLSGLKINGETRKEANLNLQTSLKDLLIENEFKINDDGDVGLTISGQGIISNRTNYSFTYNYNQFDIDNGRDVKTRVNQYLSSGFSGYNKTLIPFSYSFSAGIVDSISGTKINRISNTLSTSFSDNNLYNTLVYLPNDGEGYFRGSFGYSGSVYGARFNVTTSYSYLDSLNFDGSRMNIYKDFDSGYSANIRAEYLVNYDDFNFDETKKEDDWRITGSIAKTFERFQLSGAFQQDNKKNWNVSLGLSFSLGYDHVNNKISIASSGIYGGATLDLTAYLDRNSNSVLDENDLALPNVIFGPYKNWVENKTSSTGRVVLQGVPVNRPVSFSAFLEDGISSSVSTYSIYSHSGGYIKANIPFTIKTDLNGYLYSFNDGDSQAVKDAFIELVNDEGKVVKQTKTSHDGYYEFQGINSGVYIIRVSQSYLTLRGLKSEPSEYLLETPSQGGFVEIQEITLYPLSEKLNITNLKKVEFNIDNYDAAIDVSKVSQGIFINIDKNKKFEKSDLNSDIVKRPTLKSAVLIKNNDLIKKEPIVQTYDDFEAEKDLSTKLDQAKKQNMYGLQFGSYENEKNANEKAADLKSKIDDLNFQLINQDGLFKIISSGYESLIAANKFRDDLRREYGVNSFSVQFDQKLKIHDDSKVNKNDKKSFSGFSIQVAAVKNLNNVHSVIKDLPDTYSFYYADNNAYKIVLIGLFNDKKAAVDALADLKIRFSIDGWVKDVGSLNNLVLLELSEENK